MYKAYTYIEVSYPPATDRCDEAVDETETYNIYIYIYIHIYKDLDTDVWIYILII